MSSSSLPILFVDLDESLIKTDILREQLIRSFATSPWKTIKMLFREKFRPESVKTAVAAQIDIDPATLPYNQDVLNLIHQAKKEGRQVVLATATHEIVAHKIAAYLGVFDAVLATTPTYNCKGSKKLTSMKEFANGAPFDYVGDSHADLKIFPHTQMAYIVGNLQYQGTLHRFPQSGIFKPLWKAMRPHQWAKNGLIFLPLLTSHHFTMPYILTALIGFFVFSLAASGIYLINDMVDVEDDRHHVTKCNRPFAKGDLTVDQGLWSSALLLVSSLFITWLILPIGLGVLVGYVALTFLYSFYLKTKPIADVFCLTMLYAIRVLFGWVINDIDPSSWLLGFCVFFFLSLAFVKRITEITKGGLSSRRGYETDDAFLLKTAGIASGLLSILILALYINSTKVIELYAHPYYLWGAVYGLLYWKLKLWLITTRGQMNQDPVIFALKDPLSYGIGFVIFLSALLAKGLIF